MMGERVGQQDRLFYEFCLEDRLPDDHLLRRIDAVLDLSWLRAELAAYYSHTGCPSIGPELMIRMLLVGYCYSIRSERRLCQEVDMNLAYRWFCRLGLEDKVPQPFDLFGEPAGAFPRQRYPAQGVRRGGVPLYDGRSGWRWRCWDTVRSA